LNGVCVCVMQVNEYDCLLLEFVFGNRPDDAQKVRAYVLETIASDPGLQQTELVFLGLFGRSCRILENKDQQVSLLQAESDFSAKADWVLIQSQQAVILQSPTMIVQMKRHYSTWGDRTSGGILSHLIENREWSNREQRWSSLLLLTLSTQTTLNLVTKSYSAMLLMLFIAPCWHYMQP